MSKKNCYLGWSVKKVAHCTQVHDMWPFGPLIASFHLYYMLNGQRASGKQAHSFWQFLRCFCMEQSELLVCLHCWQTWKEFRLPWHSFVRVQIHCKYRLFINRKNSITELKIFHGAMVRAPASRIRGLEFESRTVYFPSNQIILFFLVFLFYFSQFRSKQCANIQYLAIEKYATSWRFLR